MKITINISMLSKLQPYSPPKKYIFFQYLLFCIIFKHKIIYIFNKYSLQKYYNNKLLTNDSVI